MLTTLLSKPSGPSKKKPADMGVPEALFNIVGILVGIYVFMVLAMLR
jgi:hypothetical protein